MLFHLTGTVLLFCEALVQEHEKCPTFSESPPLIAGMKTDRAFRNLLSVSRLGRLLIWFYRRFHFMNVVPVI